MRFTLWQRIFVYTIALLIVSQVFAFILHSTLYREDLLRSFAEASRKTAADLKGYSLETVLTQAKIYNRDARHNIQLTNSDGSPVHGMEFSQRTVLQSTVKDTWEFDDVVLLEVDEDPKFWGKVSLELREGDYWLYMSFGPPPRPVKSAILFQVFTPVLLVSITLGLWMAWRVSRPLRRLREELREMSRTGPGCKVTVAGNDEISEVAHAVNSMADTLAKHVQGMRSLVVNVSHELRSPLARANLALGIIEESLPPEYGGCAESLREERPGEHAHSPETRRQMVIKYLAVLQEEMNHMDALIGTTLLTQKLDLQMESTPMDTVDLSLVCENSWERYEPMFTRAGFSLRVEISRGAVIVGNAILLAQMLTNLLDNCLKYTEKNGEIHFSVTIRHGKCCLCIENSHDAMSEAQVDHIFDPFYRIDQATGTGIGLGLALVQKTVTLHKGEIMAVSTDIGLCICLQFPLASSQTPGEEVSRIPGEGAA